MEALLADLASEDLTGQQMHYSIPRNFDIVILGRTRWRGVKHRGFRPGGKFAPAAVTARQAGRRAP